MRATARAGEPLELVWTLVEQPGLAVTVRLEAPLATAQNNALSVEFASEQLGRLGNTPYELAVVQDLRRRALAGAPEQVVARLAALQAEYQADELTVVTITHDEKARLRSYELLAQAWGLAGPPEAAPPGRHVR